MHDLHMNEPRHFLYNGSQLDLFPSLLARGRNSELRRLLISAGWLLRRKTDGRYLALGEDGEAAVRWRWLERFHDAGRWQAEALQLSRLKDTVSSCGMSHARMASYTKPLRNGAGFDRDYEERTGLRRIAEPPVLRYAGPDRYARPLWLLDGAALAWQRMSRAAARQGVAMDAISGFRSEAYQRGIFARKRARGLSDAEILAVNAAPGFSEHHSGRAVDIGAPGQAPAEPEFEQTPAFEWLQHNASRFGFTLSYPRGNPHGIAYEPWHWAWQSSRRA